MIAVTVKSFYAALLAALTLSCDAGVTFRSLTIENPSQNRSPTVERRTRLRGAALAEAAWNTVCDRTKLNLDKPCADRSYYDVNISAGRNSCFIRIAGQGFPNGPREEAPFIEDAELYCTVKGEIVLGEYY